MRICRFDRDRVGILRDGAIVDVTECLSDLPTFRYPLPDYDLLIDNLDKLRPQLEAAADAGRRFRLSDVQLLSPVANPGKIVAAPVNYVKHLEEAREQPELHHQNAVGEIQRVGLFLKATSSVVGAGHGVHIAHPNRRTDHEIELAVIIGKTASFVAIDKALDYVAGYSIGLDMTIRGPEERSLRKSLDSYTVLGPWLVTSDELPVANDLVMTISVNGEVRQKATTGDLIIGIPELISWASSYYTLKPGDVILTGTPEGVGPVAIGDVMHASIDRIGAMDVRVEGAAEVKAA